MANNKKVSKPAASSRRPDRPARPGLARPHAAFLTPNPHSVTIYRTPSFVPDTMRRTLRYVQEVALVGTSGAIGSAALTLNGPYTPISVGAHQPMGWDQYIAMYKYACVMGTRVTVDFALNGATVPTILAITAATSSTMWSTGTGLLESGLSAYRLAPSSMNVPVSLTADYDLTKLLGVTDLLDDPNYWATFSANPPVPVACSVWARDVNGTSTVNVSALVVMEFDIVFLRPATIVQS